MKIVFRRIEQIEAFSKIAEKYGNVMVKNGSIVIDGESIVGLTTLGLNKVLDVNYNDKDTIVQFESEVAALGIVRDR